MEANLESWLVGKKCCGRRKQANFLVLVVEEQLVSAFCCKKGDTEKGNSAYKCVSALCLRRMTAGEVRNPNSLPSSGREELRD